MSVIGVDVKGFVVHRKRLVQSVRRPNDPCRLLHLNLNIIILCLRSRRWATIRRVDYASTEA